ncbi:MAG: carbohydrate-binding protein SusD [Adhaeribacter sp.]|nr:carbohydrate-binding protein SusD [Adhaeribacter sp.]
MKNKLYIGLILGFSLIACEEEFLDKRPQGQVSLTQLQNPKGAEGMVIGAYSLLKGDGTAGGWSANLTWGSIQADEMHKGCDPGCGVELLDYELHRPLATGLELLNKWKWCYNGVSRCNEAIKVLNATTTMNEDVKKRLIAEARFLRGHYHFEAKKIWNQVPYADENITDYKVPNDKDIWPNIMADFEYAAANLPVVPTQKGRATKGAAEAYLAKAYMYRGDYGKAKPLLETVIKDRGYALASFYWQNFNAAFENNPESIFQVQMSVNDGANGTNGNPSWGTGIYNAGSSAPSSTGYFQPSQDLVNAYKTEAGLPMLDNYFVQDVKNDMGITSAQPFELYAGTLDPRLDWSVARRGIPYLGWGDFRGQSWIRDQTNNGPYMTKKFVYTKEQNNQFSQGPNSGVTATNVNIIRLADIILMAAESEVEIGSLDKAREYVNLVRARAAKSEGFVKRENGIAAANYQIATYDTPWTNKEMARKAVRFERRLELALEGHRFFDLVRWGIADQTLNAYYPRESRIIKPLQNAAFKKGIHEYVPIPWDEIVLSMVNGTPTLKQNPGY